MMPIDWAGLLDKAPVAVGVMKDVALAGAAISTAVVGWIALGKWRQETVGKRRLELAEDVMAGFYQVQEVIHDARTPFVDAREMVKEPNVPDEIVGNAYYAPQRRIRNSFDKILDLRTKRHRFAAVFGPDAAKPWDEIESILREIDAASQTLLHPIAKEIRPSDPDAPFYNQQRWILMRGGPDDVIAPRVAQAVRDIETICRPIVQASVR